jgi:hypothetical protein
MVRSLADGGHPRLKCRRLRYRALVAELVATAVRAAMNKKAATALVRQHAAEQVPLADQARFVEVVETEIMSLHEGNIAALPPAATGITPI